MGVNVEISLTSAMCTNFFVEQLGLTENLNKKWRTFKETFYPDQGKFRYVPSQVAIRSGRDHMAWKQQYSPHPVQVCAKSCAKCPEANLGISRVFLIAAIPEQEAP